MMSCKDDDSSKPTSPNIPVAPVYDAPSENSNSMGFYSAKGDGQYGAFVNERSEFQISVPTGEYLLTYTTTIGTFYVAFRATNASILFIGLTSGVSVSEASVQKGKIINETQRNWQSNSVTLFAWPDGPAWNGVFQSDGSAAVVLIANQSVASGVDTLPEPQPATTPTQQPNGEWKVIGKIPQYSPGSTPNFDNTAKVTFNTELSTSLVAEIQTNNGWIVRFWGAKDQNGAATSISFICYTTPDGTTITMQFDTQGRLLQSSKGDGKIVTFNWETKIIEVISGSLSYPQASKLSNTSQQAKATNPKCLERANACSIIVSWMDKIYGWTSFIAGFFTKGIAWAIGWETTGEIGDVLSNQCDQFKNLCDTMCEDMSVMFHASPNSGQIPFQVELDASFSTPANGSTIMAYAWESMLLGTLAVEHGSSSLGVTYSSASFGDITVESDEITLTIVDGLGCTDSYSQLIKFTFCLLGICEDGEQKKYSVALSGKACDNGDCRSINQAHDVNFTVNKKHFEGKLSVRGSLGYFTGDVDSESLDQKILKGTWKIPGFDKCGNEGSSSGEFSGTQEGKQVELKLTGEWAMESDNCASHFTWPFTGTATFTISES